MSIYTLSRREYVQVSYCVFVVFIVDLWTPRYKWGDCVRANRFNPATSCIRICACSKPDLDVHCSVVFVFCVSWVMGFVGEFVGGKSHCIIYNSQFKHCFLDSTSV